MTIENPNADNANTEAAESKEANTTSNAAKSDTNTQSQNTKEITLSTTTTSRTNRTKSTFLHRSDKPIYYQLLYCFSYIIMGMLFSASVVVLPYLEDILNINSSQSSLIYSVFYISNIIGSIISGQVTSNKKYENSHYYCAFHCSIFGGLCIFLIEFTKSYILMILIWFFIGLCVSCINVMPCVWICRVYNEDGALIYTRMVFCQIFGSTVFSYIYNDDYINILWYFIIISLLFISFCLIFIINTPQEDELINKQVEKVLDNATIDVKQHADPISRQITFDIEFKQNDNDNENENEKRTDRMKSSASMRGVFRMASVDALFYTSRETLRLNTKIRTAIASREQQVANDIVDQTLARYLSTSMNTVRSIIIDAGSGSNEVNNNTNTNTNTNNNNNSGSNDIDNLGNENSTDSVSYNSNENSHGLDELPDTITQINPPMTLRIGTNNNNDSNYFSHSLHFNTIGRFDSINSHISHRSNNTYRNNGIFFSFGGNSKDINNNNNNNNVNRQGSADIEMSFEYKFDLTKLQATDSNTIHSVTQLAPIEETKIDYGNKTQTFRMKSGTLVEITNNSTNNNNTNNNSFGVSNVAGPSNVVSTLKTINDNENENENENNNNNNTKTANRNENGNENNDNNNNHKNNNKYNDSTEPNTITTIATNTKSNTQTTISNLESMIKTENNQRKLYVYGAIICWFFMYFIQGYTLPFVSLYTENTLNLENSDNLASNLIFSFFLGALIGRFLCVFAFIYIKFWVMTVLFQFIGLLWSIILVLLTEFVKIDNMNVDDTIIIICLYIIYGIMGCCRTVIFSAIFGLIPPIHPITSIVAAGDSMACAVAFAIGGYGVSLWFSLFGNNYDTYPYLSLFANIMQIILLFIMIPYHNKIVKENNSQNKDKNITN